MNAANWNSASTAKSSLREAYLLTRFHRASCSTRPLGVTTATGRMNVTPVQLHLLRQFSRSKILAVASQRATRDQFPNPLSFCTPWKSKLSLCLHFALHLPSSSSFPTDRLCLEEPPLESVDSAGQTRTHHKRHMTHPATLQLT